MYVCFCFISFLAYRVIYSAGGATECPRLEQETPVRDKPQRTHPWGRSPDFLRVSFYKEVTFFV